MAALLRWLVCAVFLSVSTLVRSNAAPRPTLQNGGGTFTYAEGIARNSISVENCTRLTPQGYLRWEFNMATIASTFTDDWIPLSWSNGGVLTRTDSAVYSCIETYGAMAVVHPPFHGTTAFSAPMMPAPSPASASDTVTLKVIEAPRLVNITKTQTKTSLSLTCYVTGETAQIHCQRPPGAQFAPLQRSETRAGELRQVVFRLHNGYSPGPYTCRVTSNAQCNVPADRRRMETCFPAAITQTVTVLSYTAPSLQRSSSATVVQAVGENAWLSASLLNVPYPSPTVTWSRQGTPIIPSTTGRLRVSDDSLSLNIRNLTESDAATYQIRMSNSEGDSVLDFKLAVWVPPVVDTFSTISTTRLLGENATFHVTLKQTPYPPATVVWTHNGSPVNTSSDRMQL
eukprot:scpid90438/ scgid7304/ Hemicentin-1; Fibulin-6